MNDIVFNIFCGVGAFFFLGITVAVISWEIFFGQTVEPRYPDTREEKW